MQKYAIFLSNFVIGNFFLKSKHFHRIKFFQNWVNTSDCVFAKIKKCIDVITLASAFIRKITSDFHANKVATVLGSILAFLNTVKSEGRMIKLNTAQKKIQPIIAVTKKIIQA